MGPRCGCEPSESRCRRWMPEVIPALRNTAITERRRPLGHGRAQRLAGGIATRAVDAEFRWIIELPQDSGGRLFVVKRTSRSEMFKWIRSWLTSSAAESPAAKAPAIELVPRPSDLFLNASGRACPAPTPRPCRDERSLTLAPHAPRGRGRNHAVGALGHC